MSADPNIAAERTRPTWIVSRTAAAHRDHGLRLRYLTEASRELPKGDVLRALDVPRIPLVLLADVQEVQVGTPLADVQRRHRPILAHGGDMDAKAMRERL